MRAIARYFGLSVDPDVCSRRGTTGVDVLASLKQLGLTVTSLLVHEYDPDYVGLSVAEFIKAHPKGVYYIGSKNHAMALIDGKLIDTAGRTLRGLSRTQLGPVAEVTMTSRTTSRR